MAPPCILVLFGASGDLVRRLLLPSITHLAQDGLLPERFAVVGVARDELSDDAFRARMADAVRTFSPRGPPDPATWARLEASLFHVTGGFEEPDTYTRLAHRLRELDAGLGTRGNILFYLATPPSLFGIVSHGLRDAGLAEGPPHGDGWRRVVVEKPFGHDLPSAVALGKEILSYWREDQVFRIDHYLGKETVQNLLAFRFANGIFEPLWNRQHIDHIEFTAAESVGVEGRGGYYESAGVLRDMLQNHMFQMLAYLCMEPPTSFAPDDVRDEKARLLRAVRIMTPEEVRRNTVRGQYGPGRGPDGAPVPGYREEPSVSPGSNTETFAALRLFVDNWRWEGVPIYLRSGKRLWKKGTEIVVHFRSAPQVVLRGAPVAGHLGNNRLVFHIQPDQGIALRIVAKVPGPSLALQDVNLRFAWADAFRAGSTIGYEVLLHHAMVGDGTLFSRTDLVEAAWRIAQPILEAWSAEPPTDFPNYAAGSWGPQAAYDLVRRDDHRWAEVPNREVFARVPLFAGGDPALLAAMAMALHPTQIAAGSTVVREGEAGDEMYILCRGEVEVTDAAGGRIALLREGDVFGEVALLLPVPRIATVTARCDCDLLVLGRTAFERVLREHPALARSLLQTAHARYDLSAAGSVGAGGNGPTEPRGAS